MVLKIQRGRATLDTTEPRLVGVTGHGRAPRRSAGAGQGTRKRVRRIAAFRTGAWRGTWLRRFREQSGVWRKRGRTVGITDHGCAWKGAGSFSTARDSLLRLARAVRGGRTSPNTVGIGDHGRAAKPRGWEARCCTEAVRHRRPGRTWRAGCRDRYLESPVRISDSAPQTRIEFDD